ncbi:uncharacterized protein ACHE_11573S [Aspergillus chevalieri]|uniref:Tubby C-terminal-like domain-containing protein n=1 Tax=Aspergillus chevalieri TaxID=182096 RepID=A0A7R7ZKC2_ASPCH|nr:uncharacterized protein ACHE_11573S [Aspergillus chevalieri]BCR84171.1 hypothetical protein ACHE_11573S [Aspergillus chevalieri]
MSTYSQSLLPRRSSVPKARSVLKPPERPIALRCEYITDTKTVLTLNPQGDSNSSKAYKILDNEGAVVFTVTGWKFSNRSCREFRDASGLPLFELHRNWFKFRHKWCVTLPGVEPGSSSASSSSGSGFGDGSCNGGVLATGSHRIRALGYKPFGGFSIGIERNAAAADSKKEDDKKLSLEIEKYGNVLALFDVVDGDRKVAQVRESIEHNERLALISSRADYRPVLDVIVTPGVDLSLIAIIAVIASDSVFTANV